MTDAQPIIVIKKKGGHAGHHGGAWKVAYADFVTAMMALFIVLWLMNASNQIKQAVGGYFKDPTGTSKKVGSPMAGTGENFTVTKQNIQDLKQELQKAIAQVPHFDQLKDKIEMTITSEGLRIELMEGKDSTFFDTGRSDLNGIGKDLLKTLAQQLGQVPNKISIEGHTDSVPYSGGGDYSNWELSADRANAARRLMQQSGIRQDQVSQVRGFADQQPRKAGNSGDPSNRRITLIVQYLPPKEDDSPPAKSAEAPNAKK